MKTNCKKCIYCIGIFKKQYGKKRLVCERNEMSKEVNGRRAGNYWGMDIPKYCPYFKQRGKNETIND